MARANQSAIGVRCRKSVSFRRKRNIAGSCYINENPGQAGVSKSQTESLACQALMRLAARIEGIGAETADLVLLVIFEIAFEPFHMAFAFKG